MSRVQAGVNFLLIFLSVWHKVAAQELPFVHYTPASETNPLPSAMVTNVFQDSQGFVWFSVFTSGLLRFDGATMDVYNQADGLKDLGIWQVFEDTSGHIWVATAEGLNVSKEPIGNYRHGRRLEFVSDFSGIPLSRETILLNQLAVDPDGRVWLGTEKSGIIVYQMVDGQMVRDYVGTDIFGSGMLTVQALLTRRDGTMLVALGGGILAGISGKNIEVLYKSPEGMAEANFAAMLEDPDGKLWAYRENGEVLFFNDQTDKPVRVHVSRKTKTLGLISAGIGEIWAYNSEQGIIRLDQKKGTQIGTITRANGLLSENISQIYKDREGNTWIAQSGGVSRLRFNYGAFENFGARSVVGEKPILISGLVNTILVGDTESEPFSWLAGTEFGLSGLLLDGTAIALTTDEGLIGNWVNGLSRDSDGCIWIGNTRGLNGLVFDRRKVPRIAQEVRVIDWGGKTAYLFSVKGIQPIIASERILVSDPNSRKPEYSVWMAGSRALYLILNGQIFAFGPEHGLPLSLYKSVAVDGNGHVWVGTSDRGLFRSKSPLRLEEYFEDVVEKQPVEFEAIWTRENGAPTNQIEKLRFHAGKLWVGLQEGLYAFDPESFNVLQRLTVEEGMPANNAVSFAVSPKTGNFWVGTNNGLAEVDPKEGKVLHKVSRLDGLISNEVWLFGSVQVDDRGWVYYGTANGLSVYYPERDLPNSVPPLLSLTKAEITYPSEGRNEVNFEFTALSFANIKGVRYQTRLMDYDRQWSPLSTQKQLRYTNLPAYFWPRTYTLEVKAFNESGIASEEVLQYAFSISPVWWLKWWVALIFLVMIGLFLVVVDRYQRTKLLKKERESAKLREAELQAETATARSIAAEAQANSLRADNEKKALELEKIRELQIAYEELKATQNQLIQAEKMASLGRMATGIAHEIKNPLNFINNFAQLSAELVDGLNAAIRAEDMEEIDYIMANLKQNTQKIEEHGRRADSIVRSMMQHGSGKESTFEVMDLNKLLSDFAALAYHAKNAQHAGFYTELRTVLAPDLPKVRIVAQEIGQTILNIVGNALDAVWDRAKKSGSDFHPLVIVESFREGKYVGIRIVDNGDGVPVTIRERIFEPFFTTKPTGEGTGLGLSLSYDIITHRHNGILKLEKSKSEGACFVILLPTK